MLGIGVQITNVHNPDDFAPAFFSIQAGGSEGIVLHSSPLIFGFRKDLCTLAANYKLPAIGQSREIAEAGCLVSYGVKLTDAYVIAARLTDKMLRSARPGETPAEQPNKFELVINLNTAKALGLALPQSLLGQADEVIE